MSVRRLFPVQQLPPAKPKGVAKPCSGIGDPVRLNTRARFRSWTEICARYLVLVAEQRQRFTPADPPDTDEAFRVSTIESLATSDNTNSCGTSNTCGGASVCFTLYHGATHEAPINGIYSFVPCRRADREDFRFARPALSLPVEIVNPRSWRSPKGAGRPLPPRQIRDLWTIVRDQIIAAGCLEGVHFSTPPEDHRASDAAVRVAAG